MEENHFLRAERLPTETDVALAIAYYPMLVELALKRTICSFKDFISDAKRRYPNNQFVQYAVPISTGRRFEFIRIFTKRHALPDLSAWVTNQKGDNSQAFIADFDPENERKTSAEVDWDLFQSAWENHKVEIQKLSIKLQRRRPEDARKLMAIFANDMRTRIESVIPNKNKVPYPILVRPYREPLLESIIEGKDVESTFQALIFDYFGKLKPS